MRKVLFVAIALLFVIHHTSAQEGAKVTAKLSPRTQVYMQTIRQTATKEPLRDFVYKKTTSGIYLSAIIKVNNTIVSADLEAIGVHVGTRAGHIWTTLIPIASVEAFTQIRGIDYIEFDEPVSQKLDSARRTTRVDSVHQGLGLPHAYTGQGVVVGVVDVGFDYTHPTFRDTSGNNYRISRVWEEKTPGTPPAGFTYGNEMTDSFTIQAEQTDNNLNTHGSHVLGIAAGSGFGGDSSNSKYRGMAYQSEIVLVGIMPDSSQWQSTGMSDFIDGISYIFTYAASVHKPAVVNLSWGTPVGPRDGHSLFSEACDALTGPGRIFVCAGGNEGDADIHLQKRFTATDTVVKTFVTFDPTLSVRKVWLDMWGDTAKNFCLKVGLYHGHDIANTGYVCLDNSLHSFYLIGTNHDTCFVNIVTSTSEFNGKPRIYLTLYSRAATDSVYISLSGTDGHVDVWDGYVTQGEGYGGPMTSYGYSWATQGDSLYTTSDIVATSSTISAGAYSAKVEFSNIYNVAYNFLGYTSLGQLVPFSSRGPTADGRVKPDITAPGLCVVSAVSSYDIDYRPGGSGFSDVVTSYLDPNLGTKFYWAQFSGTSMATPCTSGIIALMLEANPGLDPARIRSILAQTAILDTFTGVLPQQGLNTWGHGKINAYQAVIAAAMTTGIGPIPGNTIDCQVYPNPNNGRFTLSYTGDKNEVLAVAVYDIAGKQVYTGDWKVDSGSNNKNIDISTCSTGIYLVKVSSMSGQSMIKVAVGH